MRERDTRGSSRVSLSRARSFLGLLRRLGRKAIHFRVKMTIVLQYMTITVHLPFKSNLYRRLKLAFLFCYIVVNNKFFVQMILAEVCFRTFVSIRKFSLKMESACPSPHIDPHGQTTISTTPIPRQSNDYSQLRTRC